MDSNESRRRKRRTGSFFNDLLIARKVRALEDAVCSHVGMSRRNAATGDTINLNLNLIRSNHNDCINQINHTNLINSISEIRNVRGAQ